MSPTVSHIPVSSFNCAGCDCGQCLGQAVSAIEQVEGVMHVRVDRTRTQLVIRYDASTADAATFLESIRAAKLNPL